MPFGFSADSSAAARRWPLLRTGGCGGPRRGAVGGGAALGNGGVVGGQVSNVDNVTFGDGARGAGGMTLVAKDVAPGTTVSGFPAQEHRRELRDRAALRRLPALAEQLKDLLARVDKLEASTDHHR